jgi:hypothetical protein
MFNGSDTVSEAPLLAGYIEEEAVAKARRVTVRTLRAERQRGEGSTYIKVGKKIFYSVDGFRAWLKSLERQPVRSIR